MESTSRAHQLEVLRSTANDAVRAVVLQAHRLREGPLVTEAYDHEGFQLQTDARFLIVAIRWLHRACAGAAQLTNDAKLRDAVQEFEETVLHGKAQDMRNIWEHFDEYVVGDGRLQRPTRRDGLVGAQRTLGVYIWTGQPDTLGSLTWAGVTVNFDVAVTEAEKVYAVLRDSSRIPI